MYRTSQYDPCIVGDWVEAVPKVRVLGFTVLRLTGLGISAGGVGARGGLGKRRPFKRAGCRVFAKLLSCSK